MGTIAITNLDLPAHPLVFCPRAVQCPPQCSRAGPDSFQACTGQAGLEGSSSSRQVRALGQYIGWSHVVFSCCTCCFNAGNHLAGFNACVLGVLGRPCKAYAQREQHAQRSCSGVVCAVVARAVMAALQMRDGSQLQMHWFQRRLY